MAVYKIAQLGTGWAVFRIDGVHFEHVDGPYGSRQRALTRRYFFAQREALARGTEASAPPLFGE